jgi:hypothetical protein
VNPTLGGIEACPMLNFLGMVTTLCRLSIRLLLSTPFFNMLIIICLLFHRCPTSTKAGKITVLCILIFRFFDIRREDKRFWTE